MSNFKSFSLLQNSVLLIKNSCAILELCLHPLNHTLSLVSHLSLVSMPLFSAGSSLTYHLAPFVYCDNYLTSLHTSSCDVPRYCSRSTILHHVHYPSQYSDLFPFPSPQPLAFVQMTLGSSCYNHSTLTQAFRTFKTLFSRSLPE